jgi:rhamnulokinase
MTAKHVIAVDLGASSGRVMKVGFDGERFALEQAHRFTNIPVTVHGTLYWDVLRIWHEITEGIRAVADGAASIGVDSWGVDFALLDRDGDLLANPVHYRDSRTDGMLDWVFERVPRRTVFERTGIQVMGINTLYQLASLAAADSPVLDCAATLLTFPNLMTYWMTGARACEFTHVTTTQCYNPVAGDWDRETLAAIGVPTGIFPEIVQPGTRLGAFEGIPVLAPGCHDTADAVAAVPTTTENYAYLSSGTWSLIGLEVTEPVITDASYEANATNEGGLGGTFRLLQNVMGLWLQQECRNTWAAAGRSTTYQELIQEAEAAAPFRSLIDPNDDSFLAPGDMPARIRAYCRRTGQPEPETIGQMIRAIYESLALRYRTVLDTLIGLTGRAVDRLHVIGGGSQNGLLCQMAANAIGRTVIAGPAEATALGNGIVQYLALGDLDSLPQARALLSRTLDLATYEPREVAAWDEAYGRFQAMTRG